MDVRNIAHSNVLEDLQKFSSWLDTAYVQESTRRVYRSRLARFEQYVLDREDLGSYSLQSLASNFLKDMLSSGELKARTVNNFVPVFRLMSYHLNRELEVSRTPIPKAERQKRALNREEQVRLLRSASLQKNLRDLPLILLCLTTGIKIGEIAALKVSDIQITPEGAVICISGARTRTETGTSELAEALAKWLSQRTSLPIAKDSPYLFPGANGKPISRSSLDMAIRKVGWKTGLEVCSQILQNTFMIKTSPLDSVMNSGLMADMPMPVRHQTSSMA